MSHRRARIAAVLAFGIGALAVVAGGQVLGGWQPGYTVIGWLPVYNLGAGLVGCALAVFVFWPGRAESSWAALVLLGAHAIVALVLLIGYRGVIAPDSLVAMAIRLVVGGGVAALVWPSPRHNETSRPA